MIDAERTQETSVIHAGLTRTVSGEERSKHSESDDEHDLDEELRQALRHFSTSPPWEAHVAPRAAAAAAALAADQQSDIRAAAYGTGAAVNAAVSHLCSLHGKRRSEEGTGALHAVSSRLMTTTLSQWVRRTAREWR